MSITPVFFKMPEFDGVQYCTYRFLPGSVAIDIPNDLIADKIWLQRHFFVISANSIGYGKVTFWVKERLFGSANCRFSVEDVPVEMLIV